MTALGGKHHTDSAQWRMTAAAAATAAALAAGLTGCGADGGSTKADPTSTASSNAATSPSTSATGSTGQTALQVAAATGVQIQVPSNWHLSKQANGTAGTAPPPPGKANPPAVFSVQSSPDPLGTTGSRAQTALRNSGKNGKRLSDLHINGVTLYHVQYTTPGFLRDDFGAIVDGVFYHVGWNFGTEEGITRGQADKYMNPVMATFKLTS